LSSWTSEHTRSTLRLANISILSLFVRVLFFIELVLLLLLLGTSSRWGLVGHGVISPVFRIELGLFLFTLVNEISDICRKRSEPMQLQSDGIQHSITLIDSYDMKENDNKNNKQRTKK
jgi:hypothetical protein